MTGVASSLSSSMNKAQMAPPAWAVNASRGSLELELEQRDALPVAAAVAQRVVAVGSLEDAQPRELESRRVLVS